MNRRMLSLALVGLLAVGSFGCVATAAAIGATVEVDPPTPEVPTPESSPEPVVTPQPSQTPVVEQPAVQAPASPSRPVVRPVRTPAPIPTPSPSVTPAPVETPAITPTPTITPTPSASPTVAPPLIAPHTPATSVTPTNTLAIGTLIGSAVGVLGLISYAAVRNRVAIAERVRHTLRRRAR